MAVATFTLTGNLPDLFDNPARRSAFVQLDQAVVDTTNDVTYPMADSTPVDGLFSLPGLPAKDALNNGNAVFNLFVTIGKRIWLVPAQAAGSTHDLTEFGEVTGVVPATPNQFLAIQGYATQVAADAAAVAAVGTTNDTIIAGRVNASGSATRTATDALYAGSGTAENPITNAAAARPTGHPVVYWKCATSPTNLDPADVWIDTGTVIAPQIKAKRENITVNLGGLDWITLGADAITDSLIVWKNGVLMTSGYTLTGRELAITGAAAGDVITYYILHPGTQTAVAATTPQVIASDNFTRADSAVSLGTATVGGAWSATGTWGISSNQAYLASPNGAVANESAVFNATVPNAIAQVKLSTIDVNGGGGLMTREVDSQNGYTTNNVGFFKRVAAANAQLITYSATFVAGDTIRVRWVGTTVTVYRQAGSTGAFTSVGTATDATTGLVTATRFGLRTRSVNTARFDDFVLATAA